MKKCIIVILVIVCGLVSSAIADVRVRNHVRSNPDGNFWNNWSTYPNINPYTGARGTKRIPPCSQGTGYRYISGSSGYSRGTGGPTRYPITFSNPGRISRPSASALGTTKSVVAINNGGQRKITIRCFRVTSGFWKSTTKIDVDNKGKQKQVITIVEHFCKNREQFITMSKTIMKFNIDDKGKRIMVIVRHKF